MIYPTARHKGMAAREVRNAYNHKTQSRLFFKNVSKMYSSVSRRAMLGAASTKRTKSKTGIEAYLKSSVGTSVLYVFRQNQHQIYTF